MDPSTIEVRALADQEQLESCVELQRAMRGEGFVDVVPASMLKVAQRVGGVVIGAFDPAGQLLGFVFGLTGVENGRIVHWSDMTVVRPEARNLGVGRRLKMEQREIVRSLGASVICWTYDPLVARNAHFNFNQLGVRASEYVEDMYGEAAGVPTDRLIVAWPAHDGEVMELIADARRFRMSPDCLDAPLVTEEWIATLTRESIQPRCVRVAIPANAERMLAEGTAEAADWRLRTRRAMQWALASGYTIAAFAPRAAEDGGGQYVFTKVSRPTPV